MAIQWNDLVRMALMVGAYGVADVAWRRRGVEHVLGLRASNHAGRALAFWTAASSIAAIFWRWSHVSGSDVARVVGCGLAVFMAWKVSTKDIDVAVERSRWWLPRLGLVAGAVATIWTPAGLILVVAVLTHPFEQWRHHAIPAMRGLLAVLAYVLMTVIERWLPAHADIADVTILVFFLLVIQISHYLSAGLAKTPLGSRWWSWMVENRLHDLAASAYAWGWARFVPWVYWRRLIRAIQPLNVPLQAGVFALEVGAPLALLHPTAAVVFCVGWSAFHVGVLLIGGMWFYDWIVVNALIVTAICFLSPAALDVVFGWHAVAIAVIIIVLFPLKNRLWGPIALGWWDTPFTQRMHWIVEGESGRRYGLRGDFMCPNERLYGMGHGHFMAPVPIATYKLGLVWRVEHRDAVRAAAGDSARLDIIRRRFGVNSEQADWARNHLAYLRRFLGAVNAGRRKHVFPRGLRWLKSPGGNLYYWGEFPAYSGQERVVRCTLRFRECYFDGYELLVIRDDVVHELAIDEAAESALCSPEPASRDMEHLLLRAMFSDRNEADA